MKHILFTAPIATGLLLFAGAGIAHADDITAQCARATIPTALCNGAGGSNPTSDGGGQYVKAQPAEKYLTGYGPDKIIGHYDSDEVAVDETGAPILDDQGNVTYVQIPITAVGDPVYGTKAADVDGQPSRSGDGIAVDYAGYQYK